MNAPASGQGRAVLVCHADPNVAGSAEFTYWDSIEEARSAEAELCPCSARCVGLHTVARLDVEVEPRRKLSLIAGAPDGRRAGKRGPYDGRTKASW